MCNSTEDDVQCVFEINYLFFFAELDRNPLAVQVTLQHQRTVTFYRNLEAVPSGRTTSSRIGTPASISAREAAVIAAASSDLD